MLIMVIHFNEGTVHMAKGGNMCSGWAGLGVGGGGWGVVALAAPSQYVVPCCGTGIHCYVCILNDLLCTFFFVKPHTSNIFL